MPELNSTAKPATSNRPPLTERQEARSEWLDALKNTPEIIAERVGWLLDGNYGYGSHIEAQNVATNKRMNRAAWMGITIAALEWQCPSNFARSAWNKLTPEEQKAVNDAIMAEIDSFIAQQAE